MTDGAESVKGDRKNSQMLGTLEFFDGRSDSGRKFEITIDENFVRRHVIA